MNFECDVCVIGAGPVGSTISYYLSLNHRAQCKICLHSGNRIHNQKGRGK